jgi:uncharacterized glyoxalase superfamily protein PhnB
MAGPHHPPFVSAVTYRDPKAAYAWLEKAFGFEPFMILIDAEGRLMHSEMTFAGGMVMIGGEWSGAHVSPASVGGKNTQAIHVQLTESVDAHCERARAAGAKILVEPDTQFYGDRTYRALDPEGHIWVFAESVQDTTPEDWAKVYPGMQAKTRL